jgi:nucleotide-binding universal stress UspA family protein
MYKRILVALDGSPFAAQSLPYAQLIARSIGADVELFHALATLPDAARDAGVRSINDPTAMEATAQGESANQYQQMRQEATEYLEETAGPLRQAGLSVRTTIGAGEPSEAIAALTAGQDETLIAMSTHGRSGAFRWVLGSVTDKTLRAASAPTLVIRSHREEDKPDDPDIRRIVLPLDGSPLAEQAVPHATALAKALNANIEVFRAVSTPMYMPARYPMWGGIPFPSDTHANEYLEAMVEHIRAAGIDVVEGRTPQGDAAGIITEAAESAPDSLVVMTTHGRSGIGRWVLGSVVDKVVRHSGRPVLLVRSTDEARTTHT